MGPIRKDVMILYIGPTMWGYVYLIVGPNDAETVKAKGLKIGHMAKMGEILTVNRGLS